jgi:hypothetical protein
MKVYITGPQRHLKWHSIAQVRAFHAPLLSKKMSLWMYANPKERRKSSKKLCVHFSEQEAAVVNQMHMMSF